MFNSLDNHSNGVENEEQLAMMDIPGVPTPIDRYVNKDYSKAEVRRAMGARDMLRKLEYINYGVLRFVLNKGIIINCPYTSMDVDRTEEIYGSNHAQL